jgi:hypothetical protein
MDDSTQTEDTPKPAREELLIDVRFLIVVGGLLLLILVVVGLLFVRERSRRNFFQARATILERRLEGLEDTRALLQRSTGGRIAPEEVTVGELTIEGQTRKILEVPAEVGIRLGLSPGVLLKVGELPESRRGIDPNDSQPADPNV